MMGYPISKIVKINTQKQLNKIDALLKKYSYSESKYVVNFMGAYKFKEMFPKDYYLDSKTYEFEDSVLWGPRNYDAVLTQIYGNYMAAPPLSERFSHSMVLVE
ncbi:LicD family protein [Treponema primitia]|uniref:LicD family protein n=1 Tax=Treponema primitia TaxID=88058 RepID=UPI0002EA499A